MKYKDYKKIELLGDPKELPPNEWIEFYNDVYDNYSGVDDKIEVLIINNIKYFDIIGDTSNKKRIKKMMTRFLNKSKEEQEKFFAVLNYKDPELGEYFNKLRLLK